jgi:thiol-disulfide isomerase/thioredoxin
MMKKKNFILFLCLLFVASIGNAQTTFMEGKSWAEVKAAATKAGKNIFMDCYTSWCGPCKHMAKDIFPLQNVGEFMNAHFVCCKFDMEKGEGVALHNKYKNEIPGFPTMLIINPADESVVFKVVGASPAAELIANLKDGLAGKTLKSFQSKYEAGDRSLQLIQDYCKALDVVYDKDTKEKVVRSYVEAMPVDSLSSKPILTLYLPFLKDAYAKQYDYVVSNLYKVVSSSKMDRYEIERKLVWTMSSAVSSLVEASLAENISADSLASLKAKEDILKKLLKHDVGGFNSYAAELAVNDVRLTEDVAKLDALLDAEKVMNCIRSSAFMDRMGRYIVDKADAKKQKTMIAKYVDAFKQEQERADQRGKGQISVFTTNNYDVMAIGYARLGDKKTSFDCAKKYEDIYKVQKEELKKYLSNDKHPEVDKTYNERIATLHSKIGMR